MAEYEYIVKNPPDVRYVVRMIVTNKDTSTNTRFLHKLFASADLGTQDENAPVNSKEVIVTLHWSRHKYEGLSMAKDECAYMVAQFPKKSDRVYDVVPKE